MGTQVPKPDFGPIGKPTRFNGSGFVSQTLGSQAVCRRAWPLKHTQNHLRLVFCNAVEVKSRNSLQSRGCWIHDLTLNRKSIPSIYIFLRRKRLPPTKVIGAQRKCGLCTNASLIIRSGIFAQIQSTILKLICNLKYILSSCAINMSGWASPPSC